MNKSEKAVENFLNGYNCAQAVVGAMCEEFGMSEETGLMVSEGFGGGMGRMRETCGAVTGMFMLAGLKMSKAAPKDMDTRKAIYAKVQEMAAEFKAKMGSINCAELLGAALPKDNGATPTERDNEFYKNRSCTECVRLAAEIAEKQLLEK